MAKPRGNRRLGSNANGASNNTNTRSLSDRFREIQSAPTATTLVAQPSVRRTGVPNSIAQRLGSNGRAGVTAGRITKRTGVVGGRGARAGGANSRVAAAAAAAVAATGHGRGRGGRGGRGRGRSRGRGGKLTKHSLDAELDAYMLKDEKYAQSKLDSDLDSYMNANDEDTPMETS
ncbi:hypothetical protein BJ742DRAFT_844342 [Cladochytrium replicatum]|nr:hypothetical protein BJ742DRAFT_844342 [Cladochytrium replicatum]